MDAFVELGVERDLRVTEEELRERFDQLSAERHPDAGGTSEGFARLREAHEILRRSATRLRHWLELEGYPAERVGSVPEEVAGLFGEVGALLSRAQALVRKVAEAQSALARSLAERERMELSEELESARAGLEERRVVLEERLPGFQDCGAVACVEEAQEVAASLAFLERWEAQVREAWVKNSDW